MPRLFQVANIPTDDQNVNLVHFETYVQRQQGFVIDDARYYHHEGRNIQQINVALHFICLSSWSKGVETLDDPAEAEDE